MFDQKDIERYQSQKAPDGLYDRILADAPMVKKARVLESRAFVRSVSSIAACFVFAVVLSFMLRSGPSEFYINVDGTDLRLAGETAYASVAPTVLARTADAPCGIPIEIHAKGEVTLYAEHGEVWYTEGGANIKRMLPCTVEEGDLLYWVPDLSEHATLTMTLGDESVTYTVEEGDDTADLRIVFQK